MGALRALRELAASFRAADVLVLCYHSIRSREGFAAQMRVLAERGYPALSMGQFTEWLSGRGPVRTPAVLLTFDGGYSDQLENAVPVLQAFKFPATFFPVSDYLDDEADDGTMMRPKDLLDLAQSGHTIGCHTHSHPNLTELSAAEIQREVNGSKQILEDILGQRVSAFCYPYGARNSLSASIVRQSGFDVAFTVDLGGVSFGDDPYQLRRVPVLGDPSPGEFSAYLAGAPFVSGGLLLYWKLRERLLE
jgi:peptidoglycan/xylan/chitin deacetylase (PgdA/CDA1 family)